MISKCRGVIASFYASKILNCMQASPIILWQLKVLAGEQGKDDASLLGDKCVKISD